MSSKPAMRLLILFVMLALIAGAGVAGAQDGADIEGVVPCGDITTCTSGSPLFTMRNLSTGASVYGRNDGGGTGVFGRGFRGVYGKTLHSTGAGLRGEATTSGYGVLATSVSGYAVYALSQEYRGGYFRGAGDLHPDLILGGNSDSEDAGALMSDPAYASSDIVIYSLDDVAIHLDENGGDTGALSIVETNNNALLTTTEDGHLYVARDLYLDEWGTGLGRVLAIDTSSADLGLVANGDIDAHLDNNGGDASCFYIREHGDSVIWSTCEKKGMTVSGASAMAVETSSGSREMYAVGSPELWFEDFGSAALVDGQATVTLDPLFAGTVNLDETYHVFIQVYGDAEVYVSNRTPTHFEVHLRDGDPNVEFSYRVVAKRLGYEAQRLEATDLTISEDTP